MMQIASAALDCTFVYALIPKSMQLPKTRTRLDSVHMKADKNRQVSDLQQEYERSLSSTMRG
jgi:hypothetical protein